MVVERAIRPNLISSCSSQMAYFESLAIDQAEDKPSFWVCYMEDTFVIWPHGEHRFLEHLNAQRDPIEFTMELENDGVIPCLNVNVRKEKD